MMRFRMERDPHEPVAVLCLGAHSDDIEIGCGGAVLTIARRYPCARFTWVVFTAAGVRRQEAESAARFFAGAALTRTELFEFPDGFLPYRGGEVKAAFERLKAELNPDLIFTTHTGDAHQDHRLIAELTWNTFRNHTILEYEIPKYDGDVGRPNVFMPLSDDCWQEKIQGLLRIFASQRERSWFSGDTFQGLMRLRGMECNSATGFAEGFFCRKLVL